MKTVLKSLLTVCVIAIGISAVPVAFGGTTSCVPGPLDGIYTTFTCQLYNDGSYPLDLSTLIGPDINNNALGPGYLTVINGDPNTLADDATGLYDQNLWVAVLFWAPDLLAGSASDSLTVYWPGAFPAASVVQSFDQSLYGTGIDSAFFVQSTGFQTVYAPDGHHEYDIFTSVPEPATMLLLGLGLMGLAGVRREFKK